MSTMISVENVSKRYRLGMMGGRTLYEDVNRWWARVRKQPDPHLKIDQEHLAERMGEEFWALKDVSFEVKQGEVLGIIGRNGAGKSTLLKILSRVTAPTTGRIRLAGRVASLLEVGTGFHPELTGRENTYLNGAILGMTKREIDRKFDEIVAFSEVEQFIDTPVKRYSSGMYVRLAFAVAAHLDPEILIVDEVLAVGDAAFQKKCLGKMGDVAKGGRTVLFVSHNMAAVRSLCPRTACLHAGAVVDDGASESVVAGYLAPAASQQSISGSLCGLPRRSDVAGLQLTECSFHGASGEEVDHAKLGEPFTISVYCKATSSISSAAFAVNWFDESGTVINRTTNRTLGIPDWSFPEGDSRVDVTYEALWLLPGTYRIGLALQDVGGNYFDWIDGDIYVSVINNVGRLLHLLPGRAGGIIHMPLTMTMTAGQSR